jgi:tetratricopeptide (TPR) repeat protein
MRKILLLCVFAVYTAYAQIRIESDGFQWQPFLENGYIGAKDEKGNIIIPSDYENVQSFGGDFLVKRGFFYGIYDRRGRCIIPTGRFIQIKKLDGYKDSPFILTSYTTRAAVDKKGRILIPEDNYEFIDINIGENPGDDYYFICCKNGFWGAYDKQGKKIIAPEKYSSLFRTGNKTDGYYYSFLIYGSGSGVCDSEGNELIRTKYQTTQREKNGQGQFYYKVCQGNAYGELDLNGNVIKKPNPVKKDVTREPNVCSRSDIRMKYKFMCDENSKYGLTDKNGKVIIPYEFDELRQRENYVVVRKGRYMGAYDFHGNCIVPPNKYPVLNPNKEGGFTVKKDGLWTVLDSCGKEILPLKFSAVDLCYERTDSTIVARDCENEKVGLYRINGQQILPFSYDVIGVMFDPYVRDSVVFYTIYEKGRVGICDMSVKVIITPKYKDISHYRIKTKRLFVVKNGSKQGVVDAEGRVMIPAEQFDAVLISGKNISAYEGNRICVFDFDGNLLSDNQPELDRDKFIKMADEEFEKDNFKKAAELYNKAITIRASAYLYYNKAVSLYNNSKYEPAIIEFKNCLSMNPSQDLIDKSKYLIRKSREYQAQKEERRNAVISNVLGFVLGATNAYIQYKSLQSSNRANYTVSGYKRDTSMDYLVDPNFAIHQVQMENWNEYLTMTNGGTTMSYEEWCTLQAQALAESEKTNDNTSTLSSSKSSNSSNQSRSSNTPDCRVCNGLGDCRTCWGKGWIYNSFGMRGTVPCPNCHNHDGRCTSCGGTGKRK